MGESSWGKKPRACGFLHTYKFKGYRCGDFLGSPVVRILLLMQGGWVQYLVRELRSHMLCGKKKKKKGVTDVGTFLVVQWLRLPASAAGGVGLIPSRGTKIPHATNKPTLKKKVNRCGGL